MTQILLTTGKHVAARDLAKFSQLLQDQPQLSLKILPIRHVEPETQLDLWLDLTGDLRQPAPLQCERLVIVDEANIPWADRRFGLLASSRQAPVTAFRILRIRDELGQADVLASGSITSELLFPRNRQRLRAKSLVYLAQLIRRWLTAEGRLAWPQADAQLTLQAITRQPLTVRYLSLPLKTAAFLAQLFWRHILRGLRYRWEVAVVAKPFATADLTAGQRIPNEPHCFLADPFVVTEQGRTIVYAEELDYRSGRGQIVAYEVNPGGALTDSKLSFTRLGIALSEPFHLSFPYMFRYQDKLYLVPESSAQRDIRIYECVDFPLDWRLSQIALTQVSAVDSLIFPHGDRWWLLTNIDSADVGDHGSELHLFSAENPLAQNWQPHPNNPVLFDASRARNGGLIQSGDQLYRVNQFGGFFRYGAGITVNQIDQLDTKAYNETQLQTIFPDFFPDLQGNHHLAGDSTWTVYDSCRLRRAQDR